MATTISHYNEMKAVADASGVQLFFAKTHPRNFANISSRLLLEEEADAVRVTFAPNVIDIYDDLTDFMYNQALKNEYLVPASAVCARCVSVEFTCGPRSFGHTPGRTYKLIQPREHRQAGPTMRGLPGQFA